VGEKLNVAGSPPWQREDTQRCMMGESEAEARESHRQGLLGGGGAGPVCAR